MGSSGHIRVKGPFPPPTGLLGPNARRTESHVYRVFDQSGRTILSGTFGPDTCAAVAWAKRLAAEKGLPEATVEVVGPDHG